MQKANKGSKFTDILQDLLGSGVVVITGRKKVTTLTSQAKHLLGLAPDRATPMAFAALPAALRAVVRKTLATGKPQAHRQIKLKGKNGRTAVLRVSVAPLNPARKDSGVVVELSGLAAQRQIEDRLRQLDRLANLGTLAASMAHEIKNALVAGKTFMDLLLEKHHDTDLVEVVRREMGRIDAIVGRMLKFGGPARPAFGEVRLHDVLDHSLRLVQPHLEGKAISLDRSFQAAPDVVQGDDYQLQQAFVNLFLNALETMGPRGTLSVATEFISPEAAPGRAGDTAQRAQVRVAIKDSGAGISPEHREHLFEPFFTTKPHGTGLGLPITRRIILEHHGHISVESQPGSGAAFHVVLPASP